MLNSDLMIKSDVERKIKEEKAKKNKIRRS